MTVKSHLLKNNVYRTHDIPQVVVGTGDGSSPVIGRGRGSILDFQRSVSVYRGPTVLAGEQLFALYLDFVGFFLLRLLVTTAEGKGGG